MLSDEWTFFLAFMVVFGALGYYLWHLERRLDRLEHALLDDHHPDQIREPAEVKGP